MTYKSGVNKVAAIGFEATTKEKVKRDVVQVLGVELQQ
jgi:hypothetical protein